MKIEFMILTGGLFIFMGMIMGLTPFFSRKSVQYGVTLPIKYQGVSSRKKYNQQYFWWHTIIGIILAIPIYFLVEMDVSKEVDSLLSLYFIVAIFVLMGASAGLFLRFRKKMLTFKAGLPQEELMSEQPEIFVDTNFRKERLIVPNFILVVANLLIITLVVALTIVNYDRLPERIVTNWDMNMEVSGTVAKSWRSAMILPAMQIFMLVTFVVGNRSFMKAKQNLDGRSPQVSIRKNRAFRYGLSVMMLFLSLMIQLLFAFIQLGMIFDYMKKINFPIIIILFLVIIFGGLFYFSLKYGQSGERYRVKGQENQSVSSYDDDQNWKLGMFYFNSQDPSIWVEKRISIGTTMNMAKWQSWTLIIGVVLIPILFLFVFS